MANKRFILFNILIFLTFAVFAQSHFNQTLQWQADRNAFEYKVEVRGGGKTESYTTRQTSISVNLSAGDYEYRVIVYDFLGREASSSEWRKFSVLKAVVPEISAPKKIEAEVSGKNVELPVDIKNIEKESTVELVNTDTNQTVKGTLQIVTDSGKLVAASATFPKISEGQWKVRVTNPSGLSSESGIISIESKEKAEAEQKRLAEEQKKADLEKKKLEEQEKKLAEEQQLAQEQKRLADEEKKRVAEEEKAKLEEEKIRLEEEKRLAAEQKKLDEAERRRIAQEERQRQIEEKQRLAQEELQKRQDEAAKRAAEAEERARLAEERKQAEALAKQQRAEAKKKAQERQKEIAEKARIAEEKHKELVKIQEEEDRKRAEEERKLAEARKAEEERLAKEEAAKEKERQRLAKKEARRNAPKLDLNIQAGVIGVFSPYDGQLMDYSADMPVPFVPGGKFAVSYLPFKKEKFKLGVEVNNIITCLKPEIEFIDTIVVMNLLNADIYYQQSIIRNKLFVNVKAGAGVAILANEVSYDSKFGSRNAQSEDNVYGYLCAQSCASISWLPISSLVVELGVDFTHIFIPDMPTGIISPCLTFGYRL